MSGQSLGEILAAALAGQSDPAPASYTEADLLGLACYGDVVCLRELSFRSRAAVPHVGEQAPLAFLEAITYGRLAAAQGEMADLRHLLLLLSDFGDYWQSQQRGDLAVSYHGQALLLAEALADQGDEQSATLIANSADPLPPSVIFEAQRLKAEAVGNAERLEPSGDPLEGTGLSWTDILGPFLGSVLDRAPVRTLSQAEGWQHCARHLATEISQRSDLTRDEAWRSLSYVTNEQLALLDTPEGWTELAAWVAADRTVPEPNLSPTIH